MNPEAIEAAAKAVWQWWEENCASNSEAVTGEDRSVAQAALEAAAPFIATQALHDAAQELGSKTEDMHGNTEWWRIIAPEWLTARAAAIRAGAE